MTDRIGEVDIRRESPTSAQVTWKVKNFNDFKRGVSPDFTFAEYECFIGANLDKPDHLKLTVLCQCPSNPRVKIRLFLVAKEGSQHEIAIKEDHHHVMKDSAMFFTETPLLDKKDFWIPGGVLTVVCKLDNGETASENAAASTSEASYLPCTQVHLSQRILQVLPLSVEFISTIPDFCSLPVYRDSGIPSGDFPIPDGSAFFVLFPHGPNSDPDFIKVSVGFSCEANRGLRKPEMDCEVSLKTAEGTLYRSMCAKDDQCLGSGQGVFYRYFDRSEVIRRKDSLLPGEVLTLWIKFCSRQSSPKKIVSTTKPVFA